MDLFRSRNGNKREKQGLWRRDHGRDWQGLKPDGPPVKALIIFRLLSSTLINKSQHAPGVRVCPVLGLQNKVRRWEEVGAKMQNWERLWERAGRFFVFFLKKKKGVGDGGIETKGSEPERETQGPIWLHRVKNQTWKHILMEIKREAQWCTQR